MGYSTENYAKHKGIIRNRPLIVLGSGKTRQTYALFGDPKADARVKDVVKNELKLQSWGHAGGKS